jgi:hypothetical protein
MMDDVGQTLHDLPASSGSQSNRDFPARGDHSECCTSLQTRVSSALFQNYRCEDTSIVTESAAGAGWIGAITLQYIGIVHIPSVRCVCKDAYNAVQVPWQYVRNFPRDGITLMNDRCTLCGWFTGAKSAEDASLCCECNNTGVALHARMSLQTGVGCVGSASLKRVLHTTYKALYNSSTILECMTPWTICRHVGSIRLRKW